ncbi:pectate lyase family protein [Flavobacterium johnsoniae]|uniref:Candidate pectin or pectate lyase n=1 Tax=Flavobacterium johnsoniae (strain ATCC 17061 / DSM 2064 / JCM 8514 / BCRC 14874 / CCUG 350202 / NBRC 14942 / NCIMB 11054 / UW101) TaxID=376686 RepID=A5FKK5_FLAJ1|nr:T9SS type A sorting domain-containing protein [Flavobacterium johnsoniae]ABQ04263.1 Candidate pectin or pectate lyase [Flavobacterium johnsoniae UW101]OXG02509.1 pectate lyase [Flavobacterium johnsoniae UW101]WQG83944.1 T9SS type A sorting domain-containing protein [Flavobacterium johnsoniae UW101]SHK17243.1 Por secretion system C-terminal sorting domain-containing protein [Flavobacterium johnsoniae]
MKKNLLFLTMLLIAFQTWSQQINEASGWLESVFVKWQPVSNAQTYNVYYTGGGLVDQKIDNELIRSYGTYFRADIPGLKAGSYTVKIKPVISGVEGTGTTTSSLTVKAHDRSGFAFANSRIPGAYNADGTPKSNAVILYITQQTKNTVSLTVTGASANPCVGLQTILDGYKKGKDTRPLIIRLVGQITDLSYMMNGDLVIENNNNAASYITMEGIGNDATAEGWGIRVKNASNIEIRNIGIMNVDSGEGDNIGLQQDNDYVWVHNCDFFYGKPGSDADQIKGDGALDCKKSTYVTFSYNHFWDNGKSNLLGLSEGTTEGLFITYHHNWYDHSDSRHPRIRYYSAHVYNNYYDGNSKYGVGSTLGSSVFVEANFFRNCKYPMLTSMQGTDVYNGATGTFSSEDGGTIKAYNNTMSGQNRFVGYNATTYPVEFDAYVAATRNETISSTIKSKKGAKTYNNFDTNSSVMYTYTPESPENAKTTVMQYAGRVSGGDFQWTFNNAVDDTADGVNIGLRDALNAYQTSLVSIQGGTNPPAGNQTLTSTSNNNQTVTSGTAIGTIVFTWGGDATDATVTGLPASGLSFVKNTTAKTITITGTPTAAVTYSIATTGSAGTPATGTGTITVNAAGTQTLTSTNNNSQTVASGTAINSIVFTWGGTAADAAVTGLPASGISFVKNTSAKTITITGTPTATVSYSITTTGTGTAATGSGTITVTTGNPAGDEIHNFTTSGKTSDFYTITGNLSTTKGTVTYNGLTLTQCLKIESATSITFTTTQASTLTLVFVEAAGTIKVDNVDKTASNGIVTVSLAAGNHTIAKKDTSNLFYMVTAYNTATLKTVHPESLDTASSKPFLYPNPVSGTLYLSDQNQKVEKVQIYNVLGVLVKTSQKGNESIDLGSLASGTYLAKIFTTDGSISQTIVKK